MTRLYLLEVNDGSSTFMDQYDPDKNIMEEMINSNCNYYDENSFTEMISDMDTDHINFSLLHLNVRSLPKNFDAFNEYLQCIEYNFSVIGLSETWFTDISHDSYSLTGFKCISKHRDSRKGGGVALYINNSIQCKQRHDLCMFNDDVECVFCRNKFSLFWQISKCCRRNSLQTAEY